MAKRVIILGVSLSNPFNTATAVFWYPVTQANTQRPQAGGSVWAGASTAENTAIQNGTVIEESQSFQIPTGLTLAQAEAILLQYWTTRNAQINGFGPNLFNGVFNDSVTGWSA